MEYRSYFIQAVIYLLATVLSVPIAKRLGLGSVLGYLIAGILIGPFAFGLIPKSSGEWMHFSQFGIEMMLFLIGLELKPEMLWQMRTHIVGMGVLQVIMTSGILAAIFLMQGHSITSCLAIGMALSLSSTAIVMQILAEKGWKRSTIGRTSFSVLLFQDIAFIPMMALFPFLGPRQQLDSPFALFAGSENLLHTLLIISVVAGMFLVGKYLMGPIFRFIARSKVREIFTATALLLVIGNALLMDSIGLSSELGTFVAGLVLAKSEYRHELESDIEPFKGLLLGLFFISVGANIHFDLIMQNVSMIIKLVSMLMFVKFSVLFSIAHLFRMSFRDSLLLGISLAQGSEFCFMLLAFATEHSIVTQVISGFLIVTVAISMILTSVLIIGFEKFIDPYFFRKQKRKEYDKIEFEENPVIIAGFGRFGQIIGRLLIANNIKATVLDHDSDNIELVRKYGFKVFYGDASRMDLLLSAGLEHAKLLIIAIDDSDKALEIATSVRGRFPHIRLLIRVRSRDSAFEFYKRDFEFVYRETLDTSLAMGVDALKSLGFPEHYAVRCANLFKFHDEDNIKRFSKGHDHVSQLTASRTKLDTALSTDRHRQETSMELDTV